MTLRLRLVLALLALMVVGLVLFGFASYSLYSRSQYDRLDEQIHSSVPFVSRQLDERTGGDGGGRDEPGGSSPSVPLSTYAERRDASGSVIASAALSDANGRPDLPGTLTAGSQDRYFTAGSSDGSGDWRVYVSTLDHRDSTVLVIAVPLEEVGASLRRLVLIEVVGGAVLVAALSGGAWLILRRGLRPLEQMAGTAGRIAQGDLSQRVAPAEQASEVGRLGLALNTMLDEIEEAFAERDATEDRLRQFLADASHELRTPLTSIRGFAELYRIGDPSKVDLPTIMRRIEDEATRMKGLVEDLLLLARLDETRPLELRPVDLTVLAADACTDARAIAPDRPVTLHAPDPVVVPGDEALLRQAVGNLVANAIRHTPDGTAIDVGVARDGDDAVLSIRDHGPGLDAEALEHAFDRFWQADRARVGAGSGLGLSIVQGIAAEHGGRAEAANDPDGGARFTIRLPLPASVPSDL